MYVCIILMYVCIIFDIIQRTTAKHFLSVTKAFVDIKVYLCHVVSMKVVTFLI